MPEKPEKTQKAEEQEPEPQPQPKAKPKREEQAAPAVKQLSRNELEALRQSLQKKFHR